MWPEGKHRRLASRAIAQHGAQKLRVVIFSSTPTSRSPTDTHGRCKRVGGTEPPNFLAPSHSLAGWLIMTTLLSGGLRRGRGNRREILECHDFT